MVNPDYVDSEYREKKMEQEYAPAVFATSRDSQLQKARSIKDRGSEPEYLYLRHVQIRVPKSGTSGKLANHLHLTGCGVAISTVTSLRSWNKPVHR